MRKGGEGEEVREEGGKGGSRPGAGSGRREYTRAKHGKLEERRKEGWGMGKVARNG